ncbi:MAG: phosphorylase [Proteobacteria bacterium]|nr:phosphorylase [Pseudomonadota bacterium]
MTSTTSSTILERSALVTRKALESGALLPIRTNQTTIEERGLRFSVRWVSSLALKDQARVATVSRRNPDFNPFLPPEPDLTVDALGDAHLLVLNKFPVIDHHLLIVTRAWEAQSAPLTLADFTALAGVVGPHGGLGFYNGGTEAGASQPHKHLQWVPHLQDDGSPPRLDAPGCLGAGLPASTPGQPIANPALPWRHAFVALDTTAWPHPDQAGVMLQQAFAAAWQATDMPPQREPMAPYNLLVTRDWLLLVPRRCEKWRHVSVNSLAYAGSLFARTPQQIEELREAGPLAVLSAVGLPA